MSPTKKATKKTAETTQKKLVKMEPQPETPMVEIHEKDLDELRRERGVFKSEAKRLAVTLQEAGVLDSGAEAIALPESRMKQLQDAVITLLSLKVFLAEQSALSEAGERAHGMLTAFEEKHGDLGGPDLSARPKPLS